MQIGSILAIYFLFFVASAFILLPFGVRTDEEMGLPKVPGQADSAPHKFDLWKHLMRAAIVAFVLTGLFYANWTYGWITAEDLDFYN